MTTLYDAFAEAVSDAPQRALLAQTPSLGGAQFTFAQAAARVDALAAAYARRGWGAGHRIALAVGNSPLHFFHFLALNRLGTSIVPMNPDHRGGEIRYQLGHSKAALVVAHQERAAAVREALAGAQAPLAALPVVDADRLELDMPPAPAAVRGAASPWSAEVAILYTSGTSGLPKGCVLTNEYVLTAGAWYRDLGGMLELRPGQERVLNPLPAFHMNCGMATFAAMVLTRNCLILPDRFHASTWWEDCARSGATAMHYLGVMPPALIKQDHSPHERAHAIRFALGAGCDPTLHPQFEARFGLPLVEVWGMTETGRFLANHVEPRLTDTRAFGRARAPVEAIVADEQGRPVPAGAPGELLVRCAGDDPRRGFFAGYLDDEAATAKAWRDGWFHTGDIVWMDASGMLYFVDRRKDMIRRSGENISAGEVEAVLAAHPMVRQVAVMAVPDAMRDEEVLAVVVPARDVAASRDTAAALARHCLAELAYYKAPGWVAFRDELPVTSTNKLQKHRIFAESEDPRAGAIDCRDLKKRPRAA